MINIIKIIKTKNANSRDINRVRTLGNGVKLRVTSGGNGISITASYEKELEIFRNVQSMTEVAYIENYLLSKYDGVPQEDLPLLAA